MKTKQSNIDNWSFTNDNSQSFIEKYDIFILIGVFALAYVVIFF